MGTIFLFFFLITSFFLHAVPVNSEAISSMCPGSNSFVSDADREIMLSEHNRLRSLVASGKMETGSGSLAPAGKNVYKLTWDCTLEQSVQEAANIQLQYCGKYGIEWVIFYQGAATESAAELFKKAADNWSSTFKNSGGVKSKENLFSTSGDDAIKQFTRMAWGSVEKIACAISSGQQCAWVSTPQKWVACIYQGMNTWDSGNKDGEVVYELGSPCRSDNDCALFYRSSCSVSEGLCRNDKQGPTAYFPPSQMCPNNKSPLTDDDRRKALDEHNRLLSSLAQGLEPQYAGGNYPAQKNLYKMAYDCEMEARSQNTVDNNALNCQMNHLSYGNLAQGVRSAQPGAIVMDAIGRWWSELKSASHTPGHWLAMSSGSTKVGCAVATCPGQDSTVIVSCDYGDDRGKSSNGSPCQHDSDCTTVSGSTCSVAERLCIVP